MILCQQLQSILCISSCVEDIVLTAAKHPLYQQLCGRYCVNSCILFVSSWVEDFVSSVAKYPLYQQQGKSFCVISCKVSFAPSAGYKMLCQKMQNILCISSLEKDVVSTAAKYHL
jgi:hypothetical protein